MTRVSQAQRAEIGDAAIFVDAGSPDGLAEALRKLESDRSALQRLQEASRTRAEAWRPEAVTSVMYSLLVAALS